MAQENLVDRVQQMRGQGYKNAQIIDILQRDGYNSSQIFDAINQSGITNAGPGNLSSPPNLGQMESPDIPAAPSFDDPLTTTQNAPPAQNMPPQKSFSPPPAQTSRAPAPQAPPQNAPTADVSTEEYIEAIIDEKWVELEDDIQKIVDWKNRSEQRITQLAQQVDDLKDRFDKLHAALIGKIESYDKNILEVGAEIKAMEKVFSKVLPVFTDNVKQLQDITDNMTKKTK